MTSKSPVPPLPRASRFPRSTPAKAQTSRRRCQWSGVPEGTKELALICDDPDAPTGEPWVHWVIYKFPADRTGLPEGVPRKPRLKDPAGAMQGLNSWPQARQHRLSRADAAARPRHAPLSLQALRLGGQCGRAGPGQEDRLQEIKDHVLAEGELMGTYQR